MSIVEALAAAALTAALLYVVDRGMAFHVCLYSAIASAGRFKAEEAYRAMDNRFARPPRLVLGATIVVATFVLALRESIGERWPAVVGIVAAALAYVAISTVYAIKAFRQTPCGRTFVGR
jgi:hypothetical protein